MFKTFAILTNASNMFEHFHVLIRMDFVCMEPPFIYSSNAELRGGARMLDGVELAGTGQAGLPDL